MTPADRPKLNVSIDLLSKGAIDQELYGAQLTCKSGSREASQAVVVLSFNNQAQKGRSRSRSRTLNYDF